MADGEVDAEISRQRVEGRWPTAVASFDDCCGALAMVKVVSMVQVGLK